MLAQAEAVRPDSRKRVRALLQRFPTAVANADHRHHDLLADVLAEYADQCIVVAASRAGPSGTAGR